MVLLALILLILQSQLVIADMIDAVVSNLMVATVA